MKREREKTTPTTLAYRGLINPKVCPFKRLIKWTDSGRADHRGIGGESVGVPGPNEQRQEWKKDTARETADTKKIKREYYEQFYARSFERELLAW